MNILLITVALASAAVVLYHSLYQITHLDHKLWDGHQVRFMLMSLSVSMVCGGAVAIVLAWSPGPLLLLIGMAGSMLFDRRRGPGR